MEHHKKITIAIDGYSSCGKSTLAKALAGSLNYIFIDTGAMYRAVTLYCFEHGLVDQDHIDTEKIVTLLPEIRIRFVYNEASQKLEIELNGRNVEKEIRGLQVSSLVSKVAAIREVRQKLVAEQQAIGRNGGIVMDGRDIGSVVFPDAELKLFITADPLVRAKRRYLELNDTGVSLEDVMKNIQERDFIDSTRKESPLIRVPEALVIDNSELTPDQQLEQVLQIVKNLLTS